MNEKFIKAQHFDAKAAVAAYAWEKQHLKVISTLFPAPSEAMKVPELREKAERLGAEAAKLWREYHQLNI